MLPALRCATSGPPTKKNGPAASRRIRRRHSRRRNRRRSASIIRTVETRGAAFARLFEAVHEGVYIGTIGPDATSTIAANPHLKVIFGYASESPEVDVRP